MIAKLNDPPSLVVAIDLGGTHLRAALVDESGQIHFRLKQPTPKGTSADVVVKSLIAATRECEARVPDPAQIISALCVAVPGSVNVAAGTVVEAPNLPALKGFNLSGALSAQLGWPVVLENDANAAAAGELWLGAARHRSTIACVTLGTGVGGGIILNGELWRGVDESAGEVGHVCVEPFSEVICNCGSRGCLELYASATAIVRMAREARARAAVVPIGEHLTSEDVYQSAMKGDKVAREVFDAMGEYLAVGLINLINILNPEMIVIAGGLANAWELFAPAMHRRIGQRSLPSRSLRVEIVPGECGDDAGLLGAARLAFDCVGSKQLQIESRM